MHAAFDVNALQMTAQRNSFCPEVHCELGCLVCLPTDGARRSFCKQQCSRLEGITEII